MPAAPAFPALLTRTSTGPIRPTAAITAAKSVTSNGAAVALPPALLTSSTTAPARPASKSLTTTSAPAVARASAMPRPTPWPPPVTSARRPASSGKLQHHLPDGPTLTDLAQRVHHPVQGKHGAHVRRHLARHEQLEELLLVASVLVRLVRRERRELEAEQLDSLEQHEVQWDPRDDAGGVTDRHEPAAVAHRPQRRLRQVAADRVDDDVGAIGQGGLQALPQVAGRGVDEHLRTALARDLELGFGVGDSGDPGAEDARQLDGRGAHPATGAEDHDLVAGLDPRNGPQHVVRRAVADAE